MFVYIFQEDAKVIEVCQFIMQIQETLLLGFFSLHILSVLRVLRRIRYGFAYILAVVQS